MTLPEQQLYIHGGYRAAISGQSFETVNPANGEVICRVQQADAEDVEAAVASAREGFAVWSAMSGTQRGRVLHEAQRILRARNRELAELEVLDAGKPIQEAEVVDVISGADCIEYYAGIAASLHGEHTDLGGDFFYTRREPLGVCAGIGAWNYPIQIACWKSAPALACGNAMIFKPAELTPLTALKLAEIYTEAGLPDGVFNVVQGFAATGQALTRHPGIAKVSLTGEVGTGKKVMADAAQSLKHVTLELGGKSPNVFHKDVMREDDAFLDKAIEGFVLFALNQGEVCTCPSRALIHEDIYDAFIERAIKRTEAIVMGDPRAQGTMMGAQASEEQKEKILSYLDIGRQEGADVLTGGGPADLGGELSGGYYIQPTILKGHNKMRVFQEEIFGPVVSVTTFKDEDEALSIANDTLYGLGAGVWSRDMNTCYRFGRGIQAGRVWVNNYHAYPAHAAFGGYKQSGIGRETHKMMLDHYQQTKNMLVSYNPNKLGFF